MCINFVLFAKFAFKSTNFVYEQMCLLVVEFGVHNFESFP